MNIITSSLSPEENTETKAEGSLLSRMPFFIITGFLFLIPLFFLPSALPFGLHKSILLVVAVVISLVLWVILQLKSNVLTVLPPLFLGAALSLPVAYIISAYFSPVKFLSFIGMGFETDTVSIIALLTVLMLLVVSFYKTMERQLWAYVAFFGSFAILAIFHLIRLLARSPVLSFGIFTNQVSNTVGSWNELGIFFGAATLISFLTLELLQLPKLYKGIAYAIFYLSLFFVAVIGGVDMWYVIGIIGLIIFAYSNTFKNMRRQADPSMPASAPSRTRRLSTLALVLVIISFFFIIANGPIKDITTSFFHISSIDVRSSWSGTADIIKQVFTSKRAAVGIGPNRFAELWPTYRPQSILPTDFWNIELSSAVGFVPTSIITTGIIGLLAWIFFFAVFIYYGIKGLLNKNLSSLGRYLIASSFFMALYLWIYAIMYTPTLPLLALTFIATGLFVAACIRERVLVPAQMDLMNLPRVNFAFSLLLIVLLMGSIAWAYEFIKEVAAQEYYQKALSAANTPNNLDTVEAYLGKAITLSPQPAYYRTLLTLDSARMQQVASQKNVSQDSLKSQLQSVYAIATQNADIMLRRDPNDYQSALAVAIFYNDLTNLGIQGAYENALTAYDAVEKLNPHNPAIWLLRARLEVAHKDLDKAKDDISKALALKGNYSDAIFLLSQIQVAQGNLKDAITSAEAVTSLNPTDYSAYFNLGLLRYNDKNYEGAASAFERAIALNPGYANAQYFLGLSYYQLGRKDDAIAQFQSLQQTNPDNQEVQLILSNLQAGKDPFAGSGTTNPPIDNKPEKRAELPVKDKSKTTATSTKAVTE